MEQDKDFQSIKKYGLQKGSAQAYLAAMAYAVDEVLRLYMTIPNGGGPMLLFHLIGQIAVVYDPKSGDTYFMKMVLKNFMTVIPMLWNGIIWQSDDHYKPVLEEMKTWILRDFAPTLSKSTDTRGVGQDKTIK